MNESYVMSGLNGNEWRQLLRRVYYSGRFRLQVGRLNELGDIVVKHAEYQ